MFSIFETNNGCIKSTVVYDRENKITSKMAPNNCTCVIVIYLHSCTYHMEDITGTFSHIYSKWFIFRIEPSG